MACSACSEPTIAFLIPEEYREYAPVDTPAATLCTRCLTVDPEPDAVLEDPDFSRVSDAVPTSTHAAVPLALALDLASSLATNRAAIEDLLEAVERAGTDPLLAMDRLLADPEIDPQIDLERRRHQLEQFLY
ncbi:hypothetical protein GS429_21420 [Natronorubrum sp. JWXQ-INN-674]|uniref:Small CPxCG-related zinc finger protein n=1 Tax=Natronorubrum halalkaliphilum TaxID=2691917 RepID=A0A6B0VUJ6_9EURY|nr:DUF6276 family protein [Natronorubrum halalkaliphilum]MXV64586.1 hypothetical protein [Natronorubrum halalkaliphilum]